jgi:5-methylcytosine-specific restriction protein B
LIFNYNKKKEMTVGNDVVTQKVNDSEDIPLTNTIWKLGCNWGSNKPSFFEMLKQKSVVIGVDDKLYSPGDLIVVAEGYTVKALAKILKKPQCVLDQPELKEVFKNYEIDYDSWMYTADVEWYSLLPNETFTYRLQTGICRINKQEIRRRALELWKSRSVSYWVFQCNPDYYDYESAVRNNLLDAWTVKAHKDKIKSGDKAIIWLTGKKSGCYALAEVTSNPYESNDLSDIDFWKIPKEKDGALAVNIKITHSILDTPIFSSRIKDIDELKDLNGGNQGTNFSATKEQFDCIKRMIYQMEIDDKNERETHRNQILFGPPGTGKTYNTINEALKIVDPEYYADNKENRGKLTERYRELLISDWNSTSGQIAFCTFHQSFSYEDFVEGIKPCLSVEDSSLLRYEVESGIFKKICDLADSRKGNYDEVIEKFKLEISELEGREPVKIVASSTFDVTYKGGNVFYVSPLNSKKDNPWYPVSLNHIKKYFETGDLTGTYNTTYVKGICNFLLEKRGLTKSVNEEAACKDFVLIIDEINRGNVSSIFGELITLIEDDKRIDADEELRVVLPYSKELFGVPSNVHIIGTMNTADRSVEALDTALRRRFTFTEMPPQSELISTSISLKGVDGQPYEVNLKEMLDTINSRIERLIDKDHKIGHSYFINAQSEDDLKEAFRNKVIPLLEEYFFGDFGKIGLVLGDSFVEKVNGGFEFAAFSGYDSNVAQDLKERCVYAIKDSSLWNFRSIYTPNKAQ